MTAIKTKDQLIEEAWEKFVALVEGTRPRTIHKDHFVSVVREAMSAVEPQPVMAVDTYIANKLTRWRLSDGTMYPVGIWYER